MNLEMIGIVRYGAHCLSLVVLIAATVAAGVAAAKNRREGRSPTGAFILAVGWAGSALAALIFLALELATPAVGDAQWISLLASYLNTFMTLVILGGTALLAPGKPEGPSHG